MVSIPQQDCRKVPCPFCGRPAGEACRTLRGTPRRVVHLARKDAAVAAAGIRRP